MEPHPIPQNVTYFQFKLVGDMTLKQFIYLAAGSGLAYVLFVFFSYEYPFVAWPLIVISGSLGAGFAFLPIGSRPLDYWLKAFLKAIYSPTRRVWKKNGKTYEQNPLFQSRLVMYMTGINQPTGIPTVQPFVQPITPQTPLPAAMPIPQAPGPLPSTEELKKTVDLAREAQQLQMKIIQTERALNQIKENAEKPTTIPIDYSQEVNKIMGDLQNLIKKASEIRQQIQTVSKPEGEKNQKEPNPTITPAKIQVIIPGKPIRTTVALTSFPNIINGIIKDRSDNYLEGVVVVIYNKEGLPVRALKTNKLGQFTGSTPLLNGTYRLEIEKDGFSFDILQVELTGTVLPPIQIIAKEAIKA